MKLYRADNLLERTNSLGITGYTLRGTADVYLKIDVDAELARLKAESKSHFEQALANGAQVSMLKAEAELLKAALRWLNGEWQEATCYRDYEPPTIPEEFAPLIAEAVKS